MNKQQLANKIWASANKMRSKIEASEYKDYILGLIFYKFLSDNEVGYLVRNSVTEDYQQEYLKEDYDNDYSKALISLCQDGVGYFIEYKNLFSTWLKPGSDFSVSDLSVALDSFDRLVRSNFANVYKGIFNTLRAGLQKLGESPAAQTRALKDLIKLIRDIPTDGKQDYDVLGYVYEYLISNFAANAGKKAGEFYTPHEVAMLMSEIVAEHLKDRKTISIYDPTSGSGSLLITIGKSVGKHIADPDSVIYYAQELKESTYNLTRMNLVMRGIKPNNIHTRCADSLAQDWPTKNDIPGEEDPLCVDAVVSNPPYSQHWDPTDAETDPRFKSFGVAPQSKADYAFLLHEFYHLDAHGIMTIVLPHGVLFRGTKDDGAEGEIRYHLVDSDKIQAIIGLPANIFFGTGIPTIIMVLRKVRDANDHSVLFIDASKGFVKDGTRNRLRECDIKKIADTVRDRREIPGFSRLVDKAVIEQNDYNLNIPRYVDSSEQAEHFDIYATMNGGIPVDEIDRLGAYWQVLPTLRGELFAFREGFPYASLKTEDIVATINDNGDVEHLKSKFHQAFDGFADDLHNRLITHLRSVHELSAQDEIADEIFHRLVTIPLVDRYAAFQALADNWQTIAGDIETIKQEEGWEACRKVDNDTKMVKNGNAEEEVVCGLKGRIIPFSLVQHDFFQTELDELNTLRSRLETIASELDEIRDGFTEDEQAAYLDEQDNTKLNKKVIKADAKKRDGSVEEDTKKKLKRIVSLWDEQSKTRKDIKAKDSELVTKTAEKITQLTDEEVERLLHEKWIVPVCRGIDGTLTDVLSEIESSVNKLAKKYATSYRSLQHEEEAEQDALADLTDELTGDSFAVEGLRQLFKHIHPSNL